MKYKVFVRNWWKLNPEWPNGLEPDAGARMVTLRRGLTEAEAKQLCQNYNETHKPGKFSRKAEYTKD